MGIFGLYSLKDRLAIDINKERIIVEKKSGDLFSYRRERDGEIIELKIFTSNNATKLSVTPLRPINVPQQIARHVMICINPSFSLPPKSEISLTLTIPIEVGVLANVVETSDHLLDFFSISKPKYALYGPPESGFICRFHNSDLNNSSGSLPYAEAIAFVKFENQTSSWVSVHRIVMDAYMLDLYIKDDLVYLEDTKVIIDDEKTAQVFLNNTPPLPGLQEAPIASDALKRFRLGLLERTGLSGKDKFLMEYGY